jgi:hypothetical protein
MTNRDTHPGAHYAPAVQGHVCFDVRDADGRLMRIATAEQADKLVSARGGWFRWAFDKNRQRYVKASTYVTVIGTASQTTLATPGQCIKEARLRHHPRCDAWRPKPEEPEE